MPTQIDCPDCGGTQIKETYLKGLFSKYEDGSIITSKCPDCTDGKITVYTEADMEQQMKDNWFEAGTIGTTPLYTKVTARKIHLGKLVTEAEMQKLLTETEHLSLEIFSRDNAIERMKAEMQELRDINNMYWDYIDNILRIDSDKMQKAIADEREVVDRVGLFGANIRSDVRIKNLTYSEIERYLDELVGIVNTAIRSRGQK